MELLIISAITKVPTSKPPPPPELTVKAFGEMKTEDLEVALKLKDKTAISVT